LSVLIAQVWFTPAVTDSQAVAAHAGAATTTAAASPAAAAAAAMIHRTRAVRPL
jgi:hypothetical protein